ncbi:MAG: ECF-type sigma factor [Acidobacteriota bacterium]
MSLSRTVAGSATSSSAAPGPGDSDLDCSSPAQGNSARSGPEITALLHAWQDGDKAALEELMGLVYGELKVRARRFIRRERTGLSLQTTDLVHEVYFRFVGVEQVWQGRNHFYAMIAKKMREFLIDRARADLALRRGGGLVITSLDGQDVGGEESFEVLALHDALEDLARFDRRKAEILELRYFAGMLNREIAEGLNLSESTVEREQRLARAWLGHHLKQSQN